MNRLLDVLRGVREFVVGDDWPTAVGVIAALALTAVIAGAGIAAWWVMPAAVAALLALSLRRATRAERTLTPAARPAPREQ